MKQMFVLFSTLLFSVAVFSATEYTRTFGPKKFSPKDKYTESFVGIDKQINKIIVTNGSGKDLVKKMCSENSLEKLLCIAGNLLIDLKINLERVASTEITLNGKKIITPQNFNIKTRQLVLEVPVLENNRLVISPKGMFTSYLTIEIQAPKEVVNPQADILVALENVTPSMVIPLSGSITGNLDKIRVMNVIGSGFTEAKINADNSFLIPGFMLNEGKNIIVFEGLLNNSVMVTKSVSITLNTPAEGKSQMSPTNGAEVNVSNTNSPLYGSKMVVPPGAAERPFYVWIDHGDELIPSLPYSYQSAGPAVTFYPIWAEYLKEVTISVPIKGELPKGALLEYVTLFAFSTVTGQLEELKPSSRSNSAIDYKFQGRNLWTAFIAAVKMPLQPGELRILTNPPGAELNLDWVKRDEKGNSILSSVSTGQHQLIVYKNGYNEKIVNFTMEAEGTEILVNLDESGDHKPIVEIDGSIPNEVSQNSNIFVINGKVNFQDDLSNSIAVLSVNQNETTFFIRPDGSFQAVATLLETINEIQIRVTPIDADTGISRTIKVTKTNLELMRSFSLGAAASTQHTELNESMVSIQRRAEKRAKLKLLPTKNFIHAKTGSQRTQLLSVTKPDGIINDNIIVQLSWDKGDTDVDLHITDPDGNHAYYGDLEAIPDASIDRDDTEGPGPEVFSMDHAKVGIYQIGAHYYSDHGNGPANATISIFVGGKKVFSDSRMLYNEESWAAYSVNIEDAKIKILEVQADGKKLDKTNPVFTTNSKIRIISETPELIDDSRIKYVIKQFNYGIEKLLPSTTGRQADVALINDSLNSMPADERIGILKEPSQALYYDITPCIDSCKEGEGIRGNTVTIQQEAKGQIIQEYIDKNKFRGTSLIVPGVSEILNEEEYNLKFATTIRDGQRFNDTSKFSDFTASGFVRAKNFPYIIDAVMRIPFETIKPVINSTWRNPRRNDRLSNSSFESNHQEGNSADFGVIFEAGFIPSGDKYHPESQYSQWIHELFKQVCANKNATIVPVNNPSFPHRRLSCTFGSDSALYETNHLHISDL